MKVKELFPYLAVSDAARAIAFYEQAFGAKEKYRLTEPAGRVGHAELDFGGVTVMLADEYPEYDFKSADKYGGTQVMLHLHMSTWASATILKQHLMPAACGRGMCCGSKRR